MSNNNFRICLVAAFIWSTALAADNSGAAKKIWVDVVPLQAIYQMDELKKVQINFALVNDGPLPIDPRIESSTLLINGVPYEGAGTMFSNGPRDARWHKLQPGDSLQFGYGFEWSPLFKSPGIYRVQWMGEGFQSRIMEFRIVPPSAR